MLLYTCNYLQTPTILPGGLLLRPLKKKSDAPSKQKLAIFNLVPRAFSSFKMAVGEIPGQGCQSGFKTFVRISSHKHDEMSSFCLNNNFRLQKTNWAARRWKRPAKKPFYHASRDKIPHDSWSISAALARGFSEAILNEEKALGTRLGNL